MTTSQKRPIGGMIEDTIDVKISEPYLDYFLKMSIGYLTNSEKFSLMDHIMKTTKKRISFAFILSSIYFKKRNKNKRLCKKIEQIHGMLEMLQYLEKRLPPFADDETIDDVIDAELSFLFYEKNDPTIYLS